MSGITDNENKQERIKRMNVKLNRKDSRVWRLSAAKRCRIIIIIIEKRG